MAGHNWPNKNVTIASLCTLLFAVKEKLKQQTKSVVAVTLPR